MKNLLAATLLALCIKQVNALDFGHPVSIKLKYAEMGSKFGVVKKEDANIEQYVTNKALDSVYFMIAKAEVVIRKDPPGQASSLLIKVFGAASK